MSEMSVPARFRWFRSFYWRIGFSFVIFVVLVLVAQSAMFSYVLAGRGPLPGRSPNNVAAIVAADISSALAQDDSLDLQGYVQREYRNIQPLYCGRASAREHARNPTKFASPSSAKPAR